MPRVLIALVSHLTALPALIVANEIGPSSTHAGEVPELGFRCLLCDDYFARSKAILSKHRRRKHPETSVNVEHVSYARLFVKCTSTKPNVYGPAFLRYFPFGCTSRAVVQRLRNIEGRRMLNSQQLTGVRLASCSIVFGLTDIRDL